MSFKMKYEIQTKYLTSGTKRRSGIKMPRVGFLVSHDTGNDGSSALGNIRYYQTTRNDQSASAQTFIDHTGIYECIPVTTGTPEKAWHVLYEKPNDNLWFGDDANDIAVGIELCYTWQKGKIDNKEAYKRYVWYHAYLCYKFKLDPSKKITGHNFLDPERKSDPARNSFVHLGIKWEQFIQDVVNEYADCIKVDVPKPVEVPNKVDNQDKVEKISPAPADATEPTGEVMKLDAKTVESAKQAIDELAKAGLISSPEYWKARVEEDLPVWAYMIIEARKIGK